MANSNRDSPIVEHLANVVRMQPIDDEADRSPSINRFGRADHLDAAQIFKSSQQVRRQGMFVSSYGPHVEIGPVADGCL